MDIIIKNNVPQYDYHKTWLDAFFEFICTKIQKNHDKAIKIILFLYFSIKILVCGLFVLDVFLFNKIYYFYKITINKIKKRCSLIIFSMNLNEYSKNLTNRDESTNIFVILRNIRIYEYTRILLCKTNQIRNEPLFAWFGSVRLV